MTHVATTDSEEWPFVLPSRDACRVLRVTPHMLRRLREDGQLRTERIGRYYYYRTADVVSLARRWSGRHVAPIEGSTDDAVAYRSNNAAS